DIDKLDEPWGLELKDTQLSNFIAQQPGYAKTDLSTLTHLVFLSGHITDAQSKFNLTNLLTPQGDIVPSESKKLEKLFTSKGLSQGRSQNLVLNWQKSRGPPSKESPLLPVYHTKQLTWLGLSPAELTLLSPYLVILPEPTPLNVNTALAEVLYASLSNLAWPQALALTQPNRIRSWKNLGEVEKDLNLASGTLDGTQFSVKSNFFEINGALKYLQNTLGIGLLVQRLGNSQVIPIVRTRYTD
ncbi:MAG: type II secretion system protein GspK, partial [Gammaproteobacteria bacterium]|nr:type II secretion system protein GspK [Gammaproteobacteria bacterium]